jgi:hypothetical protein
MDKSYVSDYARFMDQYLKDHPEESEEQRRCAGTLLPGECRPDGSGNNPGNSQSA